MPGFKPTPPESKSKKGHILLELTPPVYAEVRAAAAKSGVSMKAFCRQAVRFALDNLES